MNIEQDFDVAKTITTLSPATALRLIRQAYYENRVKALSTLISSTDFSKMTPPQVKQLNGLLYHAATHNDVRGGAELLRIPVIDVNYQPKRDEYTVLIRALCNKNFKFARLLLARPDIDINKIADTGSHYTSAHNAATICTGSFKGVIMNDPRFDISAHSRLLVKQVAYQRAGERSAAALDQHMRKEEQREKALRPLRKALHMPKPPSNEV